MYVYLSPLRNVTVEWFETADHTHENIGPLFLQDLLGKVAKSFPCKKTCCHDYFILFSLRECMAKLIYVKSQFSCSHRSHCLKIK